MELLQCAGRPWGVLPKRRPLSKERNPCSALLHCPGVVGSGTPATHSPTAWGQWAVEFLPRTLTLPGGSRQCNSCNASAHQLGGRGYLPKRRLLPKERNSCKALPRRLGAVGSATPATHCLTAWGQWVVPVLQCTSALPGGSGQWNSCHGMPNCSEAVGSATPVTHCLTTWGQWAVRLVQRIDNTAWGR